MRQFVVASLAACVVIAVGLSVGFTLVTRESQAAVDEQRKLSSAAANVWQERVSQQLYAVVSTAFSLGGFALGTFDEVPDHNATNVTERMQFLAPERFDTFCAELNANIPGLLSLQLQSSGVITQAYPAGSAPIGLDLLNHPTQNVDVYRAIEAQATVVAGPFALFQGGQGIIVRYPVFSVQAAANKSLATWWGNSAIVMRVAEFLRDIGIAADMLAREQHYALWFDNAAGERVVMGNSTGADLGALAAEGEVRRVSLPNGNFWSLGTMPRAGFDSTLSGAGVGLTVGLTLVAALAVAGLLVAGFAWYARVTRSTANAPTEAPLYLIFTDIESSTQLWAVAPEEMPDVLDQHGALIRDVIKAHGGYEVKTVGDSFMIAAATCAQAVGIVTDIQAALVAAAWPATIRHFYDCEYLRVRIGAHKCTEVAPTFDEVSKGYDYYGNDVNYSARVESIALGGEVIVSQRLQEEVAAAGPAEAAGRLVEMGSAELKGIDGPQKLYRLSVPGLPVRREKIEAADVQAAAAKAEASDHLTSQHSDTMSSAQSGVYHAGDDSHAVAELVFASVGATAVASDPAAVDAMVSACHAHHDAFSALLAPFKGPDRASIVKTLTGKFGVANDGTALARLSVRIGLINFHRTQRAGLTPQTRHGITKVLAGHDDSIALESVDSAASSTA